MILVACVDNNMGMLFNNRRQSRDIKVIEHILNGVGRQRSGASRFLVDSYSANLFMHIPYFMFEVNSNMMEEAGEDDICFVERQDLLPYSDKVNGIILYKWNRDYPSDKYFDLDLSNYKKVSSREFKGRSHEKVTEEVYIRIN